MLEEQSLVDGPNSTEFELSAPLEEPVQKLHVPRPPVIDIGDNIVDILLRYDNVFRALVNAGWNMDGSSENGGLVDWCLCYGFQGKDYFRQLRNQMNYAMLRCSLFIIASMAAYINPPDLGNANTNDIFMIVVGFSAVSNLISIVCYTMFSVMINRPYAVVDSMVARVRNNIVYRLGTIFDCMGMLTLLISLLLARTGAAGNVAQPMAVLLFLVILTTWTWAIIYTDEVQTKKVKKFYSLFLDAATGSLNESAMKKIYRPADVTMFLENIDQSHHLDKFQDFPLADILLMDKADLIDLLQVNAGVSKNNNNVSAEQRATRLLLLSEVRTILDEIQRVKNLRNRI